MNKRGFSLIELMAAALVTSIVVIAAYSLISSSTNTFKEENDRRTLESNLRNAELILQRDLSRIGYHVPMDDGQTVGPNIRAVRTWTKSQDSKYFSEFSIVADLADFEEGFFVDSCTASGNVFTITLQPELLLPYTASEVASVNKAENVHPIRQKTTEASFPNILRRSFANALAINVDSLNGEHAILPINDIDYDHFTLELDKTSLPSTFQIDPYSCLKDLSIFPIVVVTYRIVESDDGLALQRCYNDSLYEPKSTSVKENTCQILINRLDYFELYPIHNSLNYITQTNGIASKVRGTYDLSADTNVINFQIQNLRGFYYMLGAGGKYSSAYAHRPANAPQQHYSTDGTPIEHIQGIAMFKTPHNSTSTATVYNNY